MIPLAEIRQAAETIKDRVVRTPLIRSASLSEQFRAQVFLKLENLQETGSFKLRGATYKLLSNLRAIGPEGVVAASAGNHAQGVALAASRAGIRARVVMPVWASISKQQATRGYGAEVILAGETLSQSLDRARELCRAGATFVHPFDDREVITGQGTAGLEIMEDLAGADLVVVPVGGGGLISGVGSAARALNPEVKVVGVQAACCPSAFESCRLGRVVEAEVGVSIADGISVKSVGRANFEIIREVVDRVVVVEEEDIAAAVLLLLEGEKILAEGAGAVPLAALLSGQVKPEPGSRVVLLVSGGNVDSPLLDRIIRRGLHQKGRIISLRVSLEDSPGQLARLLSLVAELEANVLHLHHERFHKDWPMNLTKVGLELETRGPDHAAEVTAGVREAGYQVEEA